MTLFWLIAAAMVALAVAPVLRPLMRARPTMLRRAAYDLPVYRDQLAEVERDVARGLLSAEEARAARIEIERRLLAAADEGDEMAKKDATAARTPRWLPVAIAAALPLAALAIYLVVGQPDLPSRPLAESGVVPPPSQEHADLEKLVAELSARMAADPSDPKGWLLLGRSYSSLGRFKESADAFAKAIEHGATDAPVQSAYGEALTMANDGAVPEPAVKAFEVALAADPKESRARYYLALAKAQSGALDEALDLWVKLEADATPGAPWLATVGARIDQTAKALGRDPATLPGRKLAATPTGPSAEDMQAAASMSPAERETFIRGMVDRLAQRLQQQPNDTDGWVMLATSYTTLGDPRSARDAWAKAAALAPDQIDVQQRYAESLLGVHLMDKAPGPFPPGFAEVVDRIRKLDPESGFGLFYGGALAEAAGDKATARTLWEKLLARVPADSPEQAELKRRLDALAAGG
ncbi:MAG TPA: c-type cytochrome biogenesis protein CcmI [Dongiaceae bacterium]|nr:c-type cytochrome biogenesis protein CcmI [Dongiaceae bacterium]